MPAETRAMDERYRRGLAKLKEIDGEAGERVLASLRAIAPDFATYVVEFPFGDIFSRPGLDLRTRELATVAALTAMGTAPAQLRVHIRGALNVGAARAEILEIIMQMAVFAGFPAALNGLAAAKDAFAADGAPGEAAP
jgi:4-carboxymuconolactone decarboxylase